MMKFTRSTYHGSPCWKVTADWLYADADWNTRWPFGAGLCIRIGPQHPWPDPDSKHRQAVRGFTLDLNAPLGEPNRLYLWGARREYMIGLIQWRDDYGEETRWPRLVRGQAWNWRTCEGSDRWRWIVVHPNDWRDRWARSHPAEAAAANDRHAARKAS